MFNSLRSFVKRKISQKYRFDLQYEKGKWDGLNDLPELARYSIIAGYIRYFCPHARILDLGCGEGVLRTKCSPAYSCYIGIDFSDVAIANAAKAADEKTAFRVGDLNHLAVTGTFDAIIYNESIYYLRDPAGAVKAVFSNLTDNGIFIFSIVDKHGKEQHALWEKLDAILLPVDKTKVINQAGDAWTIKVYRLIGQR